MRYINPEDEKEIEELFKKMLGKDGAVIAVGTFLSISLSLAFTLIGKKYTIDFLNNIIKKAKEHL